MIKQILAAVVLLVLILFVFVYLFPSFIELQTVDKIGDFTSNTNKIDEIKSDETSDDMKENTIESRLIHNLWALIIGIISIMIIFLYVFIKKGSK